MVDVTFRQAPAVVRPKADIPAPEPNEQRVESGEKDETDSEPIEFRDTGGRSVVLDALNINENTNSLPEEDKANLQEVKNYVLEIIKAKDLPPTVSSFKKTLTGLKGEMGLDEEMEPSKVLDRISGVVRAWRNLAFIKDAEEKQRIFLKLATLKSSKEMNKEVFKLMEDYKVWN